MFSGTCRPSTGPTRTGEHPTDQNPSAGREEVVVLNRLIHVDSTLHDFRHEKNPSAVTFACQAAAHLAGSGSLRRCSNARCRLIALSVMRVFDFLARIMCASPASIAVGGHVPTAETVTVSAKRIALPLSCNKRRDPSLGQTQSASRMATPHTFGASKPSRRKWQPMPARGCHGLARGKPRAGRMSAATAARVCRACSWTSADT